MFKNFLLIFILLCSCRPAPFKTMPITDKVHHVVDHPYDRAKKSQSKKNNLRDINKRVSSPTFGLIKGYYKLPVKNGLGAARMIQGVSYGNSIRVFELVPSENKLAIEPIGADEARGLESSINLLLDQGIKIVEISLSDAMSTAKAEQEAIKSAQKLNISQTLPPSVDYLISIDEAQDKNGPVLIGRVISKNGNLLAFKIIAKSYESSLGDLLYSLIEDCLSRLNQK